MKVKLKSGDIVKDVKLSNDTSRSNAPENKENCQYCDVGCDVRGSMDQLNRHYDLSTQKHLNLAYSANAAKVKQIQTLKEKFAEVQGKFDSNGNIKTSELTDQNKEGFNLQKLKEEIVELRAKLVIYAGDSNKGIQPAITDQETKSAEESEEIIDLRNKIVKYEKEIKANKITFGRLERRISEFEGERLRLQDQIKKSASNNDAENETVSGWVANLLNQNNELRRIHNELRIKNQDLIDKKKGKLCESCIVLKVERKALEEEVIMTSKQRKEVETECKTQKQKFLKLEQRFEKLQAQHKKHASEIKKKDSSLVVQQKLNKQVQDKLKRLQMIMAINGIPHNDTDVYDNEEDNLMKKKYQDLLEQYQEERTMYEKMAGDLYKVQFQLKQLNLTPTDERPSVTLSDVDITEPVKKVLNYHISHIREIMDNTRKTMKEYAFVTEEFYTGKPGYKCQFRVYIFGFLLGFDFRVRKGCFDQHLKWPFDLDICLTVFSENYKDKRTCTVKGSEMSTAFTGRPILEQGNQVYKNLKLVDVKDYIGGEDKLIFELVLQ